MYDEEWSWLISYLLGGLTIGLVCAALVNGIWKDDAVAKGFATYTVNERGSVKWAWKETKEETK